MRLSRKFTWRRSLRGHASRKALFSFPPRPIRTNSHSPSRESLPWSEKEMSVRRNCLIRTGPTHFMCRSFPLRPAMYTLRETLQNALRQINYKTVQIIIGQQKLLPSLCTFFVRLCPRASVCRGISRYLRHFKAAPEKLFTHPGRGALRGNGGRTNLGRKTPGIWKLFFPMNLRPHTACIVFVMTGCKKDGLCAECTTDVRRIARPLRFQFSRRRCNTGRVGEWLLEPRHVLHGPARS